MNSLSNDRGLLLGDGLFETMRSYEGHVTFLSRHWERLQKSAALLEIPIPYDLEKTSTLISELLTLNKLEGLDARIRLTLTRGTSPHGISINKTEKSTFLLSATSYQEPAMVDNIIISSIKRNECSPLANIKSLNYLDNILALKEAKYHDADEALLFNTHDFLSCATTANIFLIKNNIVYTPRLLDGALPGIMRGIVLELAMNLNFNLQETTIDAEVLRNADELFLTNSLVGIRLVKTIEGKKLQHDFAVKLKIALDEYIFKRIWKS